MKIKEELYIYTMKITFLPPKTMAETRESYINFKSVRTQFLPRNWKQSPRVNSQAVTTQVFHSLFLGTAILLNEITIIVREYHYS